MPAQRRGIQLILLATFLFAVMQVGVKWLHRLPSPEIVFFRALITLIICWFQIRHRGISPWGNNKKYLLLRGLSGAIALSLFFYTLQTLPLATAVTLQYLSPIFTILFAVFIVKESSTWRQWIAFIIALAGVVMVKGVDPRVSILSLTLGVTAAMCSGFSYNFIRKLRDHDDPLVVVFYFPLVTVPVIIPFLFNVWIWPHPLEWLILIGVGFATQGAQLAMTKAYSMEKASDIVIFKYLGIIYALLFGFFIFGETLDLLSLAGITVVIGGVLLGTLGKRQARHIAPSAETFIKQVR